MPDTPSPDRYDVPNGEDPVVCPYCGAPFRTADHRALHWGEKHDAALDDDQRAAFAEAFETESDDLRLFRLKSLVAIILLYFTILMIYALV